jgi:hypothetical protein
MCGWVKKRTSIEWCAEHMNLNHNGWVKQNPYFYIRQSTKKCPHHLYTSTVLSFIKGSKRERWELRKEKKSMSAIFDISLFSVPEKT